MDDLNPPLHEPSPLLWLMAMALALLAGHVALGFTREAHRQTGGFGKARDLALAALALGTGVFSAMALDMASQPLAYEVGYRQAVLAGAWGAAVGIGLIPALLLAWRPSVGPALLGGAVVGVGATAVQASMLWAAGLLPGLEWHPTTLALWTALSAAAAAGALWLSLVGPGRGGRHRRRWRWLAAVLLALAMLLGAEGVLSAADMATQIGSAHTGELASRWLKLLAAVPAPALLLTLAAWLQLRRLDIGTDETQPAPTRSARRRRRRPRHWWSMRP